MSPKVTWLEEIAGGEITTYYDTVT